jgi:hypothetical protein
VGVAYALLSPAEADRPEADGELDASGLNLAITSDVLKRFLVTSAIPFDEATR